VENAEATVYALVVGRVIASLRERAGWSQADLAGRVGLTQSTLSRVERGQAQPDVFTFHKVAGAFGMRTCDLQYHVDDALWRSEEAARGVIGKAPKKDVPWWQAALTAAGIAGLGGLVAFAVGAALDQPVPRRPRRPR
jgi:transcriptional regulator with XRE-family HTH domain